MKNALILLTFVSVLLFSCKKSDTKNENSSLPNKAETKAQFDNTSFGVYKGVIIGSSGYIVLRINNEANVVKGYLTIDDKKDTLSTTQTLAAGEKIINLKFTGRISSMTFNAEADGTNAEITDINIDGHPGNVYGIIVHENSTQQVFCYEGKLSGGRSGTFNCTKIGAGRGDSTAFVGMYYAAKFNLDTLYVGNGHLFMNEFEDRLYNPSTWKETGFTIQGKANNNNLTGTWDFSSIYGKGTFNCVRTY